MFKKVNSLKIFRLQRNFENERERVDGRISILQSENEQMKAKISKLESLVKSVDNNNITEPGEEPCGYPCAEYISDIDARVSLIARIFLIYLNFLVQLNKTAEFVNDYVKAPVLIPSSCQEYRDQGLKINGRYNIHPKKDLPPFEVECQFVGNIGTTILDHKYSQHCQINLNVNGNEVDYDGPCKITSQGPENPGCGDPGKDIDYII